LGAVPNFFLVGAPHAGTTSLYFYLDQHPAVYMSPIKEPCFFAPEAIDVSPEARAGYDADAPALRAYLDGPMDEKREHGLVLGWGDYLKLFKRVTSERVIGEASVAYLASPRAAAAIADRIPQARIAMMLRNPIDRLFSRYLAARARGDRATFAEWVEARLTEDKARATPGGPIWPGRYGVHVQRYLGTFAARDVRVYVYDDYTRSPAVIVRDLCSFLGVDASHPIDVSRRHNVTLSPRWPALHAHVRRLGRAVLGRLPEDAAWRVRRAFLAPRRFVPTADDRRRAIEIYRGDVRVLETLIGRELSAWLS
jgi:hypothetical protein